MKNQETNIKLYKKYIFNLLVMVMVAIVLASCSGGVSDGSKDLIAPDGSSANLDQNLENNNADEAKGSSESISSGEDQNLPKTKIYVDNKEISFAEMVSTKTYDYYYGTSTGTRTDGFVYAWPDSDSTLKISHLLYMNTESWVTEVVAGDAPGSQEYRIHGVWECATTSGNKIFLEFYPDNLTGTVNFKTDTFFKGKTYIEVTGGLLDGPTFDHNAPPTIYCFSIDKEQALDSVNDDDNQDDNGIMQTSDPIVPDLVGSYYLQDQELLNETGGYFQYGNVESVRSSQPEYMIIAQNPQAGDTAPMMSRINVTVSAGES